MVVGHRWPSRILEWGLGEAAGERSPIVASLGALEGGESDGPRRVGVMVGGMEGERNNLEGQNGGAVTSPAATSSRPHRVPFYPVSRS